MTMRYLTSFDLVCDLRTRCKQSSQKDVAKCLGFTPAFINDVLLSRRGITVKLADAMGYEKRERYVKKEGAL